MAQFQPVMLGSDINAYGMARAFHEEYGIKSLALAQFQLAPTRFSRIVDVQVFPHFTQPEVFLETLLDLGRRMKKENPDRVLLLIPCGDVYANLLSQHGDQLREYFALHSLSVELNRELSLKDTFYRACERHGLPHPKTLVVDSQGVEDGDHTRLPFGFPVAMKPADSAEWLDVDFPGRKKAFILDNPTQVDTLLRRAYAAGYQGKMILQEFVPGGDEQMRVLNAYVDQHGRVQMMFLGQPLLEDPTPQSVGNYAAILPDFNRDLLRKVHGFLEDIGYVGPANFDMKVDPLTGEYKLFEINLRQGRSSYFTTLNGFNLARLFVDDLVEDTSQNREAVYGRGTRLWMEVPRSVFDRYVNEGSEKQQALAMIKAGRWGSTLAYRKDWNPLRWLLLRRLYSNYKKGYARYFRRRTAGAEI